jgi:Protein of unknown function (DUF3352)
VSGPAGAGSSRSWLAAGAAAVAAATIAVTAGCGGDEEPPGPDPAAVTPAGAPLYGEAVVRPEGDQRDAAEGALAKLLDTEDPGAFISEQLDAVLRESDETGGITYSEDIEPWLGQTAGFFVTGFTNDGDGALLAAVTDPDAAAAAVDKVQAADNADEATKSYEGIEYELSEDGGAVGFVREFLVAGTEDAFRDAVDASTGSALADEGSFRDELATAPDDALANVYVDSPALLDELVDSGELPAGQRAVVEDQLGSAVDGPAIASLEATEDSVALQSATAAGESPAPEESSLLRELPADAWLAFAITDFGANLEELFARLRASEVPGLERFEAQIRAALGIDLGQLAGWTGDVSGYAAGTSIFGLDGGLILETTDEEESADALDAIGTALARDRSLQIEPAGGGEPGFTVSISDAPVQIVVEQREDRVAAGLGEESVDNLFEPGDTLGDSDNFGAAADALGSDYAASAFVDFEPILELVDSTGEAEGDPDYEQARPYLDHLDYLVAGQRREGDENFARLVLGLR